MNDTSDQKIRDISLQLDVAHNNLNKKFNQWRVCWKKIHVELQKERIDPSLLKEQQIILKDWARYFPEKQEDFLLLMQFIDNNYGEYMSRYSAPFREWCKHMNYTLDGEFPKYSIDAFIDIVINQESNQTVINGKKIRTVALDSIKPIIQKEYANIWERPTDFNLFNDKIRTYYNVISEKTNSKNEYLPIKLLYNQFQQQEKKYSLKMFSADVSRIIETGSSKFELSPVRHSETAILIFNRKTQGKVYRGLIKVNTI